MRVLGRQRHAFSIDPGSRAWVQRMRAGMATHLSDTSSAHQAYGCATAQLCLCAGAAGSRYLSSDISFFGVGSKNAAFYLGRTVKVVTKPQDSAYVHELCIQGAPGLRSMCGTSPARPGSLPSSCLHLRKETSTG